MGGGKADGVDNASDAQQGEVNEQMMGVKRRTVKALLIHLIIVESLSFMTMTSVIDFASSLIQTARVCSRRKKTSVMRIEKVTGSAQSLAAMLTQIVKMRCLRIRIGSPMRKSFRFAGISTRASIC